jgi:hypothetical protein
MLVLVEARQGLSFLRWKNGAFYLLCVAKIRESTGTAMDALLRLVGGVLLSMFLERIEFLLASERKRSSFHGILRIVSIIRAFLRRPHRNSEMGRGRKVVWMDGQNAKTIFLSACLSGSTCVCHSTRIHPPINHVEGSSVKAAALFIWLDGDNEPCFFDFAA